MPGNTVAGDEGEVCRHLWAKMEDVRCAEEDWKDREELEKADWDMRFILVVVVMDWGEV